jgi:hypothetical protein
MELPNRESAYIPREKLTGYLLSETHPVGKAKARLFRRLGYDENNVDRLERELLTIAQCENVNEVDPTVHGVKYAIVGKLTTPLGSTLPIRTIWFIADDDTKPRFITAYPA